MKRNFFTNLMQRPVAVTMFFVALVFLGIISFTQLSVDLLPELAFPKIVLHTSLPGAGTEKIEKDFIIPVENLLSSVPRLRSVEGRAAEGYGTIVLTFTKLSDPDDTVLFIKDKIADYHFNAPVSITHYDPNTKPVAIIGITMQVDSDDTVNDEDIAGLSRLAEEVFIRRLNQIEEVGRTVIIGGNEQKEQYLLNRHAAREGVTPSHIASFLNRSILRVGTIAEGRNLYPLRVVTETNQENESLRIPGTLFTLADAGEFHYEYPDTGKVYINGLRGLVLAVEKRYGANSLDLVSKLRETLPEIAAFAEKNEDVDLDVQILFNEAAFIQDAMDSVLSALGLGSILTLIILFICLGNPLHTAVLGISIPVSVISSFLLFRLTGIGLNIMSLGGLALGIGMMVDNSIVVSEAAHRSLQQIKNPLTAVLEGIREVAAPVTASTLTTVAVFLPILFISGTSAKLLADLAVAVTISLLVSLLVSLSLLPVLLARIPPGNQRKGFSYVIERIWYKSEHAYTNSMIRMRRHVPVVTLLFLIVFAGALYLGSGLPRELLPPSTGNRITISATPLQEIPPERLEYILRKITAELPEKAVVKALGVSGRDSSLIVRVTEQDKGFIRMTLAPGVDADEFISFLQSMTDTLAGEEMVFTIQKDPSPIEDVLRLSSNGNELRISFRDEGKAAEISQQIIERIVRTSELWPEQVRGLQNKTVFSLSLDEDFIKQEAISLSQAERSVLSALSGSTALTAVGSIHVQHQDADTYPDVESIPLHFNERVYRLGSLASITPDTAETEIIRYNGRRTVYLSYKNTPSAQAKIIDVTKMIAPQLTNLARLEIAGEEEERRSAFNNLITAFVLAFCLVYMIIAAQLESLFFPLMIMLSVPMASMGAILLFALTGTSINIMSLIGFTVALGIVINDSIILTTTMLLMRKEKSGSLNPAIEAGERRFRPIIITTLTTVVGMFPMALGGGAGANIRSPLAVAVIGGLLTATLLTLLWQPLLYSVILKRRPRT